MARSSKVEECLFCGDIPCSCNKKPKAAPKPRTPKLAIVKPETEAPAIGTKVHQDLEAYVAATKRPSPFASMGFKPASEVLKAERALEPQPVREPREPLPKGPDDDFHNALRAILFVGLVTGEEKKRVERMLPPKVRDPELDARVNQWKARHRGMA